MKYFIDTEFHEYKKQPTIYGIKVGKPIDTIELISIGLISEDYKDKDNSPGGLKYGGGFIKQKEYYAVCKDFDLKAAWNNKWLRENVLKPIHTELCKKVGAYGKTYYYSLFEPFTKSSVRTLLKWFGKTREQIAEEIKEFTSKFKVEKLDTIPIVGVNPERWSIDTTSIEFYAYYADYDWVVFCWLFGRMIDLPKGFPMYCNDLKQMYENTFKLDQEAVDYMQSCLDCHGSANLPDATSVLHEKINLKKHVPQTNEHNALADAKWNKELYKFITNL